MDIQPDLSVCIFGALEEGPLARLLEAVAAAADPLAVESVVVTTRQRAAALDARFPRVLFFETGGDEPPPVAGNRALRLAKGRYLALFTAPTLFPPETLRQLVDFLDERPEVGLAGPRLQNGSGAALPSAGFAPSGLRLLAAAAGAGPGSPRPGLLTVPAFSREVDWLAGNGLVIRREAVEELGLLAEGLPLLWDLEFGMRAKGAGWHAFFLHEARAVCPAPSVTPRGPAALLAEAGRYLLRRLVQ
ncbi:MAG: glycosyltransferase [Desulfobacteraceae bacterium]|nr:glycosyltransferase [Desulfobacteraceae bacterium]